MNIIIGIIIIIIALIIFSCALKLKKSKKMIIQAFRKGNVIVTGHKGHGKGLLFQYVISQREKKGEEHYSNIRYTDKTIIKDIRELNLDPNTYENFIDGNNTTIKKKLREKVDYYLDDSAIYMPSTYQGELIKKYKSFPLFYALQRHLYQSNTHVNAQNLGRVWDKIREQADYYINCMWAQKIPFPGKTIFLQKMIFYDTYRAAEERVRPFQVDRRILGKDREQQALKRDFESKYGTVKYLYIINILPKDHYDDRAFHEIVFGYKAQKEREKERRKKEKQRKISN